MPQVRPEAPHDPSARPAERTAPADLTFEQVYAATFALVRHNARRYGVDHKSIDDVVQDVFIAVHRQLHQFSGQCAIETWVCAFLTRVVCNYHRKVRRKGAGHATAYALDNPEEMADANDFGEAIERREAARVVLALLRRIKPSQATLFTMAYVEGMTALEISAATNINANTVHSRLRAARVAFERLLDQFLDHTLPGWISTHNAWRRLDLVLAQEQAA